MEPTTITLAISAAKAAMDIAEKAKKTFYDDKVINDAKKVSQEKIERSVDSFKAEVERNKEIINGLLIQAESNKEIIEGHNETIISLSDALITTAAAARSAKNLALTAISCAAISIALVIFMAYR